MNDVENGQKWLIGVSWIGLKGGGSTAGCQTHLRRENKEGDT